MPGPTQAPWRIVQVGKETQAAWGTPVAATARLVNRSWDTTAEPGVHEAEWQVGSLARLDPGILTFDQAAHSVDVEATFEQILYFIQSGMVGALAPTGAGADKTWTAAPVFATAPTLTPLTVQKRYTDGAGYIIDRQYPGTLLESLTVSGEVDGVLMLRANMLSQREQTAGFTFTAAIAAPTGLEAIAFNTGQMYVDNTWAGIGATPQTGRMISFEWVFNSGLVTRRYGSGSLYASAFRRRRRGVEFRATMDLSTESEALRALVRSRALRAVRFQFDGTVIPTTAVPKSLKLDAMATFRPQPAESTREDDDTVEVRGVSIVDPTAQQDIRMIVVNALATMP